MLVFLANFNDFISIKHKGSLVENEKELAELFNTFFVNDVGETPLVQLQLHYDRLI